MLVIRRYLPAPPLRAVLNSYYIVEGRLPPGMAVRDAILPEIAGFRVQLGSDWRSGFAGEALASLPRAHVTGFTIDPIVIAHEGPFKTFGVGILPLGWNQLIGMPAHIATRAIIDAREVLGHGVDDYIDRLLAAPDDASLVRLSDGFFQHRLAKREKAPCSRIQTLDQLLARHEIDRVDRLAACLEMSARQLERWMLAAHGTGPKMFLKKQRFLATLADLRRSGGDWREAAALRYYDQSHFIRDFKHFTGETPGRYFAQRHALLDPTNATRDRLAALKAQAGASPQILGVEGGSA
ncbi:MAG: helix-turn-helix domain-containing protein [Pseudomonadota bacterium]|jgi:AraC-like DNA-binding protein